MEKEFIFSVLEHYKFKGKYLQKIKTNTGVWDVVLNFTNNFELLSEVERLYLYLNPMIIPYCSSNNIKRFFGISKGFSNNICKDYLKCKTCKDVYMTSIKKTLLLNYGVTNACYLENTKIKHSEFFDNIDKVNSWNTNRESTNLQKYGVKCVFESDSIKSNIKATTILKYGVENVSSLDSIKDKKRNTCNKNYNVDYPFQSDVIKDMWKNEHYIKFGVEYPMQLKHISNKAIATKIKNGTFDNTNSSKEATLYFREYYKNKGYDITQIAYSDKEYNLFEFGYNFYGKWFLYDFVAFELGFRGNKDKIIEIVEYHGPFHYTKSDSLTRGNEMAFPWKSKSTTIKESFELDNLKEHYAKLYLCKNYNIIWSDKYHTNN